MINKLAASARSDHGVLNFKTAAGLSPRSVASYKRILEQWADYAGDKKVHQFSDHEINAYMVYIRTM